MEEIKDEVNKPPSEGEGIIQDLFSEFGGMFDDEEQSTEDLNFDNSLDDFGGPTHDDPFPETSSPSSEVQSDQTSTTNSESSQSKKEEAGKKGAKGSKKTQVKAKRTRNSLKIERGNRDLPPPSWHSEAADRPHRKTMVIEM